MTYEVAPFAPGQRESVLEMLWGHWSQEPEVNASYFDWKYRQNPILDCRPHCFVVRHQDRIVGFKGYHAIGWRFGSSTDTTTAMVAGDTMILPGHRGRGLTERLYRYSLDQLGHSGFPVALSLSAGPATYLRGLRSGMRAISPYLPLQRIRTRRPRWRLRYTRGLEIALEPRPVEMAELVSECEPRNRVRLCRDKTFFEWRYRSPLSRYHFLYLGGDRLDAYLVLQKRILKRQRGMRMVDWAYRDVRYLKTLLNAAASRIDTERLYTWSGFIAEDARRCLESLAFEPFDDTRGSRFYRPGPQVAILGTVPPATWRLQGFDLADPDAWRLQMICSDSC